MNQPTGLLLPSFEIGVAGKPLSPKRRLRVALVFSLLASDFVALLAGVGIPHLYQFGTAWTLELFVQIGVILVLYSLCAVALRACVGEALVNTTESLRRGLLAVGMAGSILMVLLVSLTGNGEASRTTALAGFALSIFFTLIFRGLHVRYARKQLSGNLYEVLLLQDGNCSTPIGETRHVSMLGIFDPTVPTAEDYQRLAEILSSADRVVVRCPQERRDVWAHVLQGMNVHAEIVAPELTQTGAIAIDHFHGRPTYVVARGPLSLRDRLVKRSFDIVIACIAIVFLLPAFLTIALLIKSDSRGPVFFRQQRIGRQNRLFTIYKFRSMTIESADARGVRSASRQDDRVTRVGRIIRSTSLDELPQLINVLKGDMSIVGPRPHAVHSTAESKLFWEVDHRYWYRHACKPGITGLAQIRGFRGATLEECDLKNRLEADLEYIGCWSLWNDIAIVAKTAAVLVHRNAF